MSRQVKLGSLTRRVEQRQGVHDKLEDGVEDVLLLDELGLQDDEVHEDVADGGEGVLAVHHLELGVVDQVERLGHLHAVRGRLSLLLEAVD